MGGAVILNWVLGAIIFVLIVGGGVYAIFRHGKAGPDDQEARQHYAAKADPNVTPLGEHVPAEPVAAAHGLTESQSPRQDATQNASQHGGQASTRPSGTDGRAPRPGMTRPGPGPGDGSDPGQEAELSRRRRKLMNSAPSRSRRRIISGLRSISADISAIFPARK